MAVGLALAGCAAGQSAGTAAPPSGDRSTTSAPATGGTPHPGVGLRGVHVTGIDCYVTSHQPAGVARPLPLPPKTVILCPVRTPLPRAAPVPVSPVPPQLLAALALPDTPAGSASGTVCAMYMDVPRVVYAQLANGSTYRLSIPEDQACHHYLNAALLVLDRYRPTPTPIPLG